MIIPSPGGVLIHPYVNAGLIHPKDMFLFTEHLDKPLTMFHLIPLNTDSILLLVNAVEINSSEHDFV